MNHPHLFTNVRGGEGYVVNTIVRVNGELGRANVQFILDSGAAISVVDYKCVGEPYRNLIQTNRASAAVGANGHPLNVVGQVQMPVKLGEFEQEQTFTVARDLSVDCLLGADFLVRNGAILDCQVGRLSLKDAQVPVIMGGSQVQPDPQGIILRVAETTEIPARSVLLVQANMEGIVNTVSFREGLVEPSYSSNFPKHLLIARSLSEVGPSRKVLIQIVNISPESKKLYKGTRIGEFTPHQHVHIVEEWESDISYPTWGKGDVDLSHCDLPQSEKEKLMKLINEFSDIFASQGCEFGCTSVVKHEIKTEGPPVRQQVRRIPVALKNVVDREVEKMLKLGVVRPSQSPWSSPTVMVRKKDGAWRFCVDFRKVNSLTHRDAYPLPRIDSTLDTLKGSTLFTTLDLASGYWQVEVKEEDKEKTAFSTEKGHYEFNKMPFGLTNAPATFQRLMECVLAGIVDDECLH